MQTTPLVIEQIEEFFGAEFEPSYPTASETRNLFCFDGQCLWRVMIDENRQLLHFTAGTELTNTFPTLEIGVFCSGMSIDEIYKTGKILILQPRDETQGQYLVGITKTLEGKFSFCTSIGATP